MKLSFAHMVTRGEQLHPSLTSLSPAAETMQTLHLRPGQLSNSLNPDLSVRSVTLAITFTLKMHKHRYSLANLHFCCSPRLNFLMRLAHLLTTAFNSSACLFFFFFIFGRVGLSVLIRMCSDLRASSLILATPHPRTHTLLPIDLEPNPFWPVLLDSIRSVTLFRLGLSLLCSTLASATSTMRVWPDKLWPILVCLFHLFFTFANYF